MSDLRSAIYDDIDWYIHLCEKYGEEPVSDKSGIDPYSDHAHALQDRSRRESRDS